MRIRDFEPGEVFYDAAQRFFVRTKSERSAVQIGTGDTLDFHAELDDKLSGANVFFRPEKPEHELESTAIRIA